jgi:hypothetical protein
MSVIEVALWSSILRKEMPHAADSSDGAAGAGAGGGAAEPHWHCSRQLARGLLLAHALRNPRA